MRIDFFFFESEGGGTEFHPINICVYYEIEKKEKRKKDPIKYMCIMKQKKKKKKEKEMIELNNLREEKRTCSFH